MAAIAAAVGISERYVHKLFKRSGTTFASYVMDRRLDGAARDLKDPAIDGRAIGEGRPGPLAKRLRTLFATCRVIPEPLG